MAAWPTTLPAPLMDGFAFEPVDPVNRTEMEAGPKRARRVFTQVPTNCAARWIFSEAEFAVFESFHHSDLLDGASWFDFPFRNGQGSTIVSARFSKQFRASMVSGEWEVAAELEIRNRPIA